MPIDADAFRLLGRATAGAVAVICANSRPGNGVVAFTASSFVILSLAPPLAMFAIQHSADSYSSMVESEAFGVSLLTAHQSGIARRFARKGRDKTDNYPFERGTALAVPLIPDSLAQIECGTAEVLKSGDHAIIVGSIEAARAREERPLLYFSQTYGSFERLPA
jgi:flavin reductase (DIM6/NTAB) family NADH-FMN oxidoreductase RutF